MEPGQVVRCLRYEQTVAMIIHVNKVTYVCVVILLCPAQNSEFYLVERLFLPSPFISLTSAEEFLLPAESLTIRVIRTVCAMPRGRENFPAHIVLKLLRACTMRLIVTLLARVFLPTLARYEIFTLALTEVTPEASSAALATKEHDLEEQVNVRISPVGLAVSTDGLGVGSTIVEMLTSPDISSVDDPPEFVASTEQRILVS